MPLHPTAGGWELDLAVWEAVQLRQGMQTVLKDVKAEQSWTDLANG
jgi:hypothetical protein